MKYLNISNNEEMDHLLKCLSEDMIQDDNNLSPEDRDGVPKATQLFAINEKWLLVKCMKRFFFLCVILASDIVSYKI